MKKQAVNLGLVPVQVVDPQVPSALQTAGLQGAVRDRAPAVEIELAGGTMVRVFEVAR